MASARPCRSCSRTRPGAAGSFFGYRVALSGSIAVFGGDRDYNGNTVDAGSVFTFERQADGVWKQQGSKLQGGNTANTNFGGALALSGTRLVVGAPGNGTTGGVFYVYERMAGAWVLQTKVSTTVSLENFGTDVSLDGDRVSWARPALRTTRARPTSSNDGRTGPGRPPASSSWPQTRRPPPSSASRCRSPAIAP